MIIKIEMRVEEEIVDVHHEIPRMVNHHQNQTLQGRINNVVTIMIIIERRMVVQKLILRKMEIRIMPLLPRVIRITNHKKIKNQKMTVPREAVVVIIKIRRRAGVVTLDIPMSIAAVVDDEGIEIVHEVDHAVVDQVTSGTDPSVENVIEIIGRAGQTGIDDLIVHIIITGQDLDHVKGQGREVEEEEVTIIIEGHPDQTEIDDHTVDRDHVNVGLEAGRRSRLIIEVVVLVIETGDQIDQDQ